MELRGGDVFGLYAKEVRVPSPVRGLDYQQRCHREYGNSVSLPELYTYPDGNSIRPLPPVQTTPIGLNSANWKSLPWIKHPDACGRMDKWRDQMPERLSLAKSLI